MTFQEAVLCGFAHLATVLRWAGGGWPTRDLDIERRSCAYSPAVAEAA